MALKTQEVLGPENAGNEKAFFTTLRAHVAALAEGVALLESAVAAVGVPEGALAQARAARDGILPAMAACRKHADALERLVDDALWPLPKYAELLWTN